MSMDTLNAVALNAAQRSIRRRARARAERALGNRGLACHYEAGARRDERIVRDLADAVILGRTCGCA